MGPMLIECKHQHSCSGCRHIGVELKAQHAVKVEHLGELLKRVGIDSPPVAVLSPAAAGLRDRADLVVHQGKIGLYAKDVRKDAREVVDIETCAQLSPALQSWFNEVRKIKWPVEKGSLRIRVGPHGERGIWLDFANVDIKKILDEKSWLLSLQSQAFVEIGQRHKVPVFDGEIFKLRDPSPQTWFQTWIAGEAVDLYCTVASFTQPGFQANREIITTIDGWLNDVQAKNVLEFGSGIGNLSFAALGANRRLTACEIDERSLEGFRQSLEAVSKSPRFADVQSRVEILRGDFQNKNARDFSKYDTVLVNPPRSGLKNFLAPLLGEPKFFIYMSCFPQTFAEDGVHLQRAGYKISEIKILDQFPQTEHYEVLSLWKK